METQTPTWRQLALPASFAALCGLLLLITWLTFGGSIPLKPHSYRASVVVPQATNLNPGADVQVAGVKVGKIVEVGRSGNGAELTLEIDDEYAPLRESSTAIARSKTLLGEGFLELAPGSKRAPAIPDGGAITASNVTPNQQLDQMLQTFSPATRKNLRGLFGGMATAFGDASTSLSGAVGNAAPATANVATLLTALDSQRPELQRLLASSGDVLSALGARQGALQAAIRSGDGFLDATARRNRELAATVAAFPPFLRSLRNASNVIDDASGDLNEAVASLRPAAPELPGALRAIEAGAPEFEKLFKSLPAAMSAGNRGLPALGRTARASKPALAQLYPAARDLSPVMKLVAADRFDAIGILASIGSVTNGKAIGPGGRPAAYGTGVPTIWNEAIGGWKKKLPTNRPNAYPKPGALELKPLGHLKTFQCSHTKNTLYLPPTGTGMPPCLVQGPWEFDGKSRYYPRLDRAAP
jgi:phospholipid/cholesterol/gamma-HCH transport system substrate-binding protein